jgi:hypothetical protein
LTSTGHGAAACTTVLRLEVSYDVRTSSGSFSIRTNIVGTTWVSVTRYSWTARRKLSGSKRCISTTVPPSACTTPVNRSGAAW